MSVFTRAGAVSRRLIAMLVALATAAGLMVVGAGTASAANRDWLRPDATGSCDWDPANWWVQRCDVYSPAMGRNIPVQIQPAQRGGNASLYLLDGMRATDRSNAWLVDTNAAAAYADYNLTLVMPVGGAGSFYADWNQQASLSSADPVIYMWETFLTSELPAYLEANFGVARNNNSIAGLSMGGTAALNLAAKHPAQFRQAMSWSGYLNTTAPGMQTMLRLAMLDTGGFNVNAMYGSIINPRRFENDPFWNMAGLHGTDVYISAASGLWGPADNGTRVDHRMTGSVLEFVAMTSTRAWEAKARLEGLNPTADYPVTGIHSWAQFNSQLYNTRERVLNVMNAW
ncbi:alpha/beta hydrolase [Corynebacterium pacaense]|uniref:alpha/beta hydrolase n=1 Tax=Corynebacterium pacaense TaxID=1816684 RepID=UPI0009BAE9E4|nr:alpha/beta hydrolase family protein [Corynebacterium pacaense]